MVEQPPQPMLYVAQHAGPQWVGSVFEPALLGKSHQTIIENSVHRVRAGDSLSCCVLYCIGRNHPRKSMQPVQAAAKQVYTLHMPGQLAFQTCAAGCAATKHLHNVAAHAP
jgi:hypothetical protein